MQYLRSHSVAHMDLKPQNILLTAASNPIIKIAGREREREGGGWRERESLHVCIYVCKCIYLCVRVCFHW